jgi:hypothetical protein
MPVCPSCGNDAERGRQARARRIAVLRAEFEQEKLALDARAKQAAGSRRWGCLPLLIIGGVLIAQVSRPARPAARDEGMLWHRFDRYDSVSRLPKIYSRSPKR